MMVEEQFNADTKIKTNKNNKSEHIHQSKFSGTMFLRKQAEIEMGIKPILSGAAFKAIKKEQVLKSSKSANCRKGTGN